MAKPRIEDVARLAGVSPKTVSRVVNREPNVKDATQAKVERAVAELGYRPDQFARNLASQRARLIALVYDDPSAYEVPSSGYVIRLQQGTLRACRAANYELLIHPCRYRSKDVVAELEALLRHIRPTGVVLAAPLSNMPRIVDAIHASGTPLVRISPGRPDGNHYCVATNDLEISAEMTRYLASLGHRRIAFIKGNRQHKAVGNRYLGFVDGLRASGLELEKDLVEQGDNSVGSGEACAWRLLRSTQPPTAVFAANDDMAAGVMRVAAQLGIAIPGRLSVAGCDDISLARQIYPSLTTIRQPIAAMAELATLALVDRSRKDSLCDGITVVPAQLRIRESTGPAPSR